MRPCKCRHLRHAPRARFFKPLDAPGPESETVLLKEEELEALLLADVRGLEQEEAARQMNVSRPTFSRILASARGAAATALTQGASLRIEGGNGRFVASNRHHKQEETHMPNHDGTGPKGQGCCRHGGHRHGPGQECGCGGKGRHGRGKGCGRAQGPENGDEAKSLEILIAHEENRLHALRERLSALRQEQA